MKDNFNYCVKSYCFIIRNAFKHFMDYMHRTSQEEEINIKFDDDIDGLWPKKTTYFVIFVPASVCHDDDTHLLH